MIDKRIFKDIDKCSNLYYKERMLTGLRNKFEYDGSILKISIVVKENTESIFDIFIKNKESNNSYEILELNVEWGDMIADSLSEFLLKYSIVLK